MKLRIVIDIDNLDGPRPGESIQDYGERVMYPLTNVYNVHDDDVTIRSVHEMRIGEFPADGHRSIPMKIVTGEIVEGCVCGWWSRHPTPFDRHIAGEQLGDYYDGSEVMLTDVDRLCFMLNHWGVLYQLNQRNGDRVVDHPHTCVTVEQIRQDGQYPNVTYEENPKVDGYSGFFTEYFFELDGKFIKMGAWE